jgi:glycosyltransferase involved in cell wall biosynthesis
MSMAIHIRRKSESLAAKIARQFNWRFEPKPVDELLRFRPNVIVINSDSLGWVLDSQLVETLGASGVPYIVVVHGAGGFFEDNVRAIARELYSNAHKVCFVSEFNRRMITRHLAVDLSNARVIRNPVNPTVDPALPIEFPQQREAVVMATVSRLNCYTKGHDWLLEALASKEVKELNFRCLIYGGGDHARYIEELIAYFGLGEKVRLCGHTADVASIWKKSHIHVLPSITEGGPPIALAEAMLCGRPSVATRVGGVSEWLVDGENGFLAENAHPNNLVPAICRAFERMGEWEAMGKLANLRAKRLIGDPIGDFTTLVGSV